MGAKAYGAAEEPTPIAVADVAMEQLRRFLWSSPGRVYAQDSRSAYLRRIQRRNRACRDVSWFVLGALVVAAICWMAVRP